MRLYFHPESDSLFWDDFASDPLCDDVTDLPLAREKARERGINEPEAISEVIDAPKVARSKGIANAIVASYKRWERKPADLYPTPVDGTESLIPVLKAMKRPDGSPIKRIWEPACGDGRLARVLEWHGFEVIATDLREYPGYGHGGIDFLLQTPQDAWGLVGDIDAIVTNPPFSLAEEFIRRSHLFTPNVAMLLKQTYWNVGGRSQGLWFDHMPDLELKVTWRLAFLANERGNSPLMDCMWCVWSGENDKLALADQRCAAAPLPRRRYPGYGGIGVKSAMQVLEGELDALVNAMGALRGEDT